MSRPLMAKPNRAGSANVLGRTLSIRGRVDGEGDLTVEGSVEGDVRVSGDLAIDGSGSIVGNATARSVDVGGKLDGDVQATGDVWLRAGSTVSGNMSAARVALEEGAGFQGRIEADFELPDGLLHGFGARPAAGGVRRPSRK